MIEEQECETEASMKKQLVQMSENIKLATDAIQVLKQEYNTDALTKSIYKELYAFREDLAIDESFRNYFIFLLKLYEYAEKFTSVLNYRKDANADIFDELKAFHQMCKEKEDYRNLNQSIESFSLNMKKKISDSVLK